MQKRRPTKERLSNPLSSHHHIHLNPALEPDYQSVIVDRDLLDQLPDQPFVGVRHLGGLLRQKGFELI